MVYSKEEHITKLLKELANITNFDINLLSKYDNLQLISEATFKLLGNNLPYNPEILEINYIYEIKPQGIKITKPGIYKLVNNIKWFGKNTNCIKIESDDVILDFDGFFIEYIKCYEDNKGNAFETIGISIRNQQNILIKNGLLKSFSYYGISGESVQNIKISKMQIQGIGLNNLDIRLLSPIGIFIKKSSLIKIIDCVVSNLKTKTDSCAGIQLFESTDGEIKNCLLDNLVNLDGAVQGYSYILSSNIITEKCVSKNFQSFFESNILTAGHTVIGFIPIFSIELEYNDCVASNIVGCCDDCHGFSVFLNAFVKVNSFISTDIYDGITPSNTGAKATGLEVYGSNILIQNSICKNIFAVFPQDKQSTGFSVGGFNVQFINCVSENVQVVNELLEPIGSLSNGFGTGFGWAPDPRLEFRIINADNIKYINCVSKNCDVGFDTWNHQNSFWIDTESSNFIHCFLFQTDGTRTISCNPCSECNPGFVITLLNTATNNTLIDTKCIV